MAFVSSVVFFADDVVLFNVALVALFADDVVLFNVAGVVDFLAVFLPPAGRSLIRFLFLIEGALPLRQRLVDLQRLLDRGDAFAAVLQMQAQDRAPFAGEYGRIASRLGELQGMERVRAAWDL